MKRFLILALAALALVYGFQRARRALRSPEEALRDTLVEMEAGFESGHTGDTIAWIHPEFRDESSGASRDDLRDAMRGLILTQKHHETHAFNLDAEIPVDQLVIELAEDEASAEVTLTVRFHETRRDGRHLWWDARATCDFVHEGGDWWLFRTRQVNHRERRR